MATSSRPFQSQTVARLVAGYRQMAHEAGRWLRKGCTAAVWGLQVAVYPLYVAVQGVRLGYRQLRAKRPWQPLWASLTGTTTPEPVGADTPIRALLSVIQPPVIPSPKGQSLGEQPSGGQSLGDRQGLKLVNGYGRWLRQSRAGAVLTPGRWYLIPFQAPIRGIASDLATRNLVLVTVHNDIFTELTDDQRQRLHQAMVLMLAEYARLSRRHALDHTLQQPRLPLPRPSPLALPPWRWLPKALRWLQTSPLAAATSLFGEAQQTTQAIARPRPAVSGTNLVVQATRLYLRPSFPAGTRERTRQLHGQPARASLPGTSLVAEAVALIVAGPSAVVESLPSPMARQSLPLDLSVEPDAAIAARPERLTTLEVRPTAPLASPPALEAQVTQVHYVDAPLVAVLRGLDWVLYAIETWLRGCWAWLQKHW